MSLKVKTGSMIAESYTVTRIRDGKISPDMSAYVDKAIVLDWTPSMKSIHALLLRSEGVSASRGQWPLIGLAGLSGMQVKRVGGLRHPGSMRRVGIYRAYGCWWQSCCCLYDGRK